MFEKSCRGWQNVLAPPKSTPLARLPGNPSSAVAPLKKGDFNSCSPFFKGGRGDQNVVGLGSQTCVYIVARGERFGEGLKSLLQNEKSGLINFSLSPGR
jgi:hypothetical protein